MARGHLIDGSTTAIYKLDESNLNFLDSSGNGINLTATSATGSVVESMITDNGQARFFDGGYAGDGSAGQNGTWTAFFAGEHTVELWLRLRDGDAVTRRIFEFGAAGETQADNSFYFEIASDLKLTIFWENGAGVDVIFTTAASLAGSPRVKRVHLAYRKRSVGGGNYVVDFYENGTLLESSGSLANYDGGTNGIMTLGGKANLFAGRMDDIRFSNVSRTAPQITESYNRGSSEPVIVIEE